MIELILDGISILLRNTLESMKATNLTNEKDFMNLFCLNTQLLKVI